MNNCTIRDYVKAVKSLYPGIKKGDVGIIEDIHQNPSYFRVKWSTGISKGKNLIVSDKDIIKISHEEYFGEII